MILKHETVVCRACDGDGILAADDDTPPDERVTRDSRRCNYCGGKGHVRRKSAAPTKCHLLTAEVSDD